MEAKLDYKISPIQLKRSWIVDLIIQSSIEEPKPEAETTYTATTAVGDYPGVPNHYHVTVTVEIGSGPKAKAAYEGKVSCSGVFQLLIKPDTDVTLQERRNFAATHAASMLYSMIREVVAGITARAPWGVHQIPTMQIGFTSKATGSRGAVKKKSKKKASK